MEYAASRCCTNGTFAISAGSVSAEAIPANMPQKYP